jgi:hypothetical protein
MFIANVSFGDNTRGGEIKSRGEALNMLKHPRFVGRAMPDWGRWPSSTTTLSPATFSLRAAGAVPMLV